MSRQKTWQGDSVPIGEFAEPRFVQLPEPVTLFRERAERFRTLAVGHILAPYLTLLAYFATVQQRSACALIGRAAAGCRG
jgi:FdhE protein